MTEQSIQPKAAFRLTSAIIALASLSACASSPPLLVAGATSSHIAQTYQTNTSTSATAPPSALVGSSFRIASAIQRSVVHSTGSLNYQSGAIKLDDGTYTFVDPDGASSSAHVADGAGATGVLLPATAGGATYDYVYYYNLRYPTSGGDSNYLYGYAGIVTANADMPVGGSATYTSSGNTDFYTQHNNTANTATDTVLHYGNSAVNVDFTAGTASVNMDGFTYVTDGLGAVYPAGANPIDQVRGTGLVISGAQLSGGTWVTMKNGAVVNMLGTGATAVSDGAFYGYDPTISAPDEVAGVVLITGATQYGVGKYIAD